MIKHNYLKKPVLSPAESLHSSTSYSEPSVVTKEKKEQTNLNIKNVNNSLCRESYTTLCSEAYTTFPLKNFKNGNLNTDN